MRRRPVLPGFGLALEEVAETTPPGPGEVVVQVEAAGICGSDVHAYTEGWAYAPGTCGHEWVGVVSQVGPGVTNVAEGDRVAGGVSPGCGRCDECRAGLPVSVVSDRILTALTAAKPRTRYVIPNEWIRFWLVPLQFGNVAVSMFMVTDFSASFTA